MGGGGFDDPQVRQGSAKRRQRLLLPGGHAADALVPTRQPQLTGGAEGGDLGHGLGTGPASVFLAAAQNQGLKAQSRADIQGADALGRVDLVAADADHVGPQGPGRKGDLQKSLHRVGVQQGLGAGALQLPSHGGDVRHGAGLVVDQHQGDEDGVRPQSLPHRLHRDGPGGIRLQPGHFKAPALQLVQGFAHRVMLHQGADHVPALALHGFRPLEDGPVVALRAAGGEDQLLALAAQGRGHLPTALIQQLFCLPAHRVGGVGVAVYLRHGPQGGLGRLGADLRGGGIVQIMFHRKPPLAAGPPGPRGAICLPREKTRR